MLRHLTATSSRSLLAKPNTSIYAPSHRLFQTQNKGAVTGLRETKEPHSDDQKKPKWSFKSVAIGFCAGAGTMLALSWTGNDSKNDTWTTRAQPTPTGRGKAGSRAIEGMKMTTVIKRPLDLAECRPIFYKERVLDGMEYRLRATAHIKLPNLKATGDFNEICDALKLADIYVERSEDGANRGLAEFALKQMYVGYHEMNKASAPGKKMPSVGKKTKVNSVALAEPNGFRFRRPSNPAFTVRIKLPHASATPEFKKTCDELKLRGIEIDRAITDASAFHVYYRKGSHRKSPEDMKEIVGAMEKLMKMEKDAAPSASKSIDAKAL